MLFARAVYPLGQSSSSQLRPVRSALFVDGSRGMSALSIIDARDKSRNTRADESPDNFDSRQYPRISHSRLGSRLGCIVGFISACVPENIKDIDIFLE